MSIPETPYTRKEAYLNAAATGDTSGIPETPYTREEMYLDAIAKNGGGGGGGGSSSLSGLTDVDISNPTNGQTLVYNATSGKWENGESAGGGVLILHEISVQDNASNAKGVPTPMIRLDKTWQEIYDAGVCFVERIYSQGDEEYKKLLPVSGIMTPIQEEGITTYTVAAYDAEGPSFYLYGVNEGGANGYPERVPD